MKTSELPIPIRENDLLRLFKWHRLEFPAVEPECSQVAMGSFLINTRDTGLLAASPGAGVAVALYDRVAGVGGIAHFLFAEPQTGGEKGATVASGLPGFIDALIAAGAAVENLEAGLAGGSFLVDSLKDREINLGSLAVDKALDMLKQESIPVAALDVGGLQPLSMLLDTADWKISIKLMMEKDEGAVSIEMTRPSPDEIEKAIAGTKPIPQIALHLIRLLGAGKEQQFSAIAEEIKRDQVIVSKILRFCNSPIYNRARNIESIERALVILGEDNLLEIAVSSAADLAYSGHESGYALMRGGLYRHALATAYAAKEIALCTGDVDPGVAYTAGLVHDIGKIVLDRFVADSRPLFYRNQGRQEDYVALEQKLFATNHMKIGYQLAEAWELPESLASVIHYHHRADDAPTAHMQLVSIVSLADHLATIYLAGVELERFPIADLPEKMDRIGIQGNQLHSLIDAVPWKSLMYM